MQKYKSKTTSSITEAILDIIKYNSEHNLYSSICVLLPDNNKRKESLVDTANTLGLDCSFTNSMISSENIKIFFKLQNKEFGTGQSFSNLIVVGDIKTEDLYFWLTRVRLESNFNLYFIMDKQERN